MVKCSEIRTNTNLADLGFKVCTNLTKVKKWILNRQMHNKSSVIF